MNEIQLKFANSALTDAPRCRPEGIIRTGNVYLQYNIGTISRWQMDSLLHPEVLNFQRRGGLRDAWQNGPDKALLSPTVNTYFEQKIAVE